VAKLDSNFINFARKNAVRYYAGHFRLRSENPKLDDLKKLVKYVMCGNSNGEVYKVQLYCKIAVHKRQLQECKGSY
jgi:hypothetical protein